MKLKKCQKVENLDSRTTISYISCSVINVNLKLYVLLKILQLKSLYISKLKRKHNTFTVTSLKVGKSSIDRKRFLYSSTQSECLYVYLNCRNDPFIRKALL